MITSKSSDFQDQLFFDNLGDEGSSLQKDATRNLGRYHAILNNYLQSIKKNARTARFTWKRVRLPSELEDSGEGFAIKLDPVQGEHKADLAYTQKMFDRILKQEIKRLCWEDSEEKRKKKCAKISDTSYDGEFITVDILPPPNSLLFPDINGSSVQNEIAALRKLMDSPEKHHLPLMRLAAPESDKFWEEPDAIHGIKWKILTDDSFPGVTEQRDAVMKALSTKNFAVLEGPPGSGKTTVISEIILQLLSQGRRLLLVGSTHIAVDNVLEKLIKHTDIVVPIRIAPLDRELPEEIENLTYSRYVKHFKKRLMDSLLKIRNRDEIQEEWLRDIQQDSSSDFIQNIVNDSINLVSGTTMGVLQFPEIKDSLSKKRFDPLFDAMIIDEASKTTFQEFLVPAMFSRKWIVSGDPKQLSPYTDREFIETQIENFIRKEYGIGDSQKEYANNQYVCLTSFYANSVITDNNSNDGKEALILMNDEQWDLRDKLADQLRSLNQNAVIHIVPDKWNNVDLEKLIINGSDIIISRSSLAGNLLDAIPYGCVSVGEKLHSVMLSYQNSYLWKNRKPANTLDQDFRYKSDEEKTLSQEVAWRMERAYEMRLLPQKAAKFNFQVKQLLPINNDGKDSRDWRIWDIMYCSFPSIVELLASGNLRIKPPHRGSVLDSGFPANFKTLVWTRLVFQYRMHPDISKFPRELVYTSENDGTTALRDSGKVNRKWNYKRYDNRVSWINVFSERNSRSDGINSKNRNDLEARKIMEELDVFMKFAEGSRPQDSPQWTVAIMSFYKPQTKLMQSLIAKRYKGKGQVFFNHNKSVKIFVGNVDSMQGREADMVFLSMVRRGGLGFLDNTNRINVSITRAKYQLVVVGNHRLFCNPRYKDTLIYRFATRITPDLNFWRMA